MSDRQTQQREREIVFARRTLAEIQVDAKELREREDFPIGQIDLGELSLIREKLRRMLYQGRA